MRIGILLLSVILFGVSASSQEANPPVAFEAAVIKPPPPPQMGVPVMAGILGGPGSRDPELMHAMNCSLANLLQRAYGLDGRYQVSEPQWMLETNFDITARLPKGATEEQFRLMLRKLLAERFGMKIHIEKRELPGYRMTVAKGGPHLTQHVTRVEQNATVANEDGLTRPVQIVNPGLVAADGFPVLPPGGTGRSIAGRHRDARYAESMDQFARELSGRLGRPVENATGLTGEYNFSFYYITECSDCNGQGLLGVLPTGPALQEAVEKQLGLRLEASAKSPVDVLVVDHIEKTPTDN